MAMLIVLISLGAATIMTTAYLASRDNSAMIGVNTANSASSRWASTSGIELAVAVMQTDFDWRTRHQSGRLIKDHPVAGGMLHVDLVDLVTNMPPTEQTQYVRIIATTVVDGVTQIATADASAGGGDESVDIDLSEFAIYADADITVTDSATVTTWPVSPGSATSQHVSMASRSLTPGAVSIASDNSIIDTTIYRMPGSSQVLGGGASNLEFETLPDTLIYPSPATPDKFNTKGDEPLELLGPGMMPLFTNTRYTSATIGMGSILHLSDGVTLHITGDLEIRWESGIYATGRARLIVDGMLRLRDNAGIVVADGGTIEIITKDDVVIVDSYLGNLGQGSEIMDRNTEGNASWLLPDSISLIGLNDGSSQSIEIKGNSVVKASIYCPDNFVRLSGMSAVYGRIAGEDVELCEGATLYYDPLHNRGNGFINGTNKLWKNRRLDKNVKRLDSFDRLELESLADSIISNVTCGMDVIHPNVKSGGGIVLDDVNVLPTPRPHDVSHEFESVGVDTEEWETFAEVADASNEGTPPPTTETLRATSADLLGWVTNLDPINFAGGATGDREATKADVINTVTMIDMCILDGLYYEAVMVLEAAIAEFQTTTTTWSNQTNAQIYYERLENLRLMLFQVMSEGSGETNLMADQPPLG